MPRQVQEPAIGRGRYLGVPVTVEEGCYWLISAAMFAVLVIALAGL